MNDPEDASEAVDCARQSARELRTRGSWVQILPGAPDIPRLHHTTPCSLLPLLAVERQQPEALSAAGAQSTEVTLIQGEDVPRPMPLCEHDE